MRQFERMGAALAQLLAALLGKGPQATIERRSVEDEVGRLLTVGPEELPRLAPEALIDRIQQSQDWNEQSLDQLADALVALAEAYSADSRERADAYRRQALALLDLLNRTSTSFSMERNAKASKLQGCIS